MRAVFLLLAASLLPGCEMLSGESDQKIYDAEAIGYACRISQKKPEDCMKENDTQSPSSVLDGWKAADKDIREKVIDANMGARPTVEPAAGDSSEAPAASEAAAAPSPEAAAPAPAAPATGAPAAAQAPAGDVPKADVPKIEPITKP